MPFRAKIISSENLSMELGSYFGFAFREYLINNITKNEYQETIVTSILPNWDNNISRVHTFAYDDGLSMIDAKIKRMR